MNSKYWPHAPEHRLSHAGTYFVTVGTYRKIHFFKDGGRLAILHEGLLKYAQKYGWRLEAWAVFPNHYASKRRASRAGTRGEPISVVQCRLV